MQQRVDLLPKISSYPCFKGNTVLSKKGEVEVAGVKELSVVGTKQLHKPRIKIGRSQLDFHKGNAKTAQLTEARKSDQILGRTKSVLNIQNATSEEGIVVYGRFSTKFSCEIIIN